MLCYDFILNQESLILNGVYPEIAWEQELENSSFTL